MLSGPGCLTMLGKGDSLKSLAIPPGRFFPLPLKGRKVGLVGQRRFFDVSMTIENGMISWPGDGPVIVERITSFRKGDRVNLSRLEMSAHTGTHVDAPVHYLEGGKGTEAVPLEILLGPAHLVHIKGVREIGKEHLQASRIPQGTRRLLIGTDNGRLLDSKKFEPGFSFLTPEAAVYLLQLGVGLLGVDYLSVAQYGRSEEVHRELLGAGIVIIEGLDLRNVPPGPYQLVALPLRIQGCDGAPARVILEEQKEEKG